MAGRSPVKKLRGAHNTREMRLALDIDGTITSDPDFFARLAQDVIRGGGEVHVVSSRSPEARRETLSELSQFGIRFSALHLIPTISAAQSLCPHRELDWFQRHLWLKVDYALANGITHFVDDDRKVLALFARFAPSVAAIDFEDRERLLQRPITSAEP
jgi:hypothetical protein